jgi:DNA/RNA-binding domain of Phe-tRNA-synthetase-like protein
VIEGPDVALGFVAPDVAEEFPELALAYACCDVRPGRSPAAVRERLRVASDRFTGGRAVTMRQQPIPAAYRVFFRHIGIDPDDQRTPIEAIAVERMRAGGFVSHGVVEDALLLATLETGVPVQAFDAAAIEGRLGLRPSAPGERLDDLKPLRAGSLTIADERRPLAVLFGDVAANAAPGRRTRRVALAAIRVKGVPAVSVEEALWTAVDTLTGAD